MDFLGKTYVGILGRNKSGETPGIFPKKVFKIVIVEVVALYYVRNSWINALRIPC